MRDELEGIEDWLADEISNLWSKVLQLRCLLGRQQAALLNVVEDLLALLVVGERQREGASPAAVDAVRRERNIGFYRAHIVSLACRICKAATALGARGDGEIFGAADDRRKEGHSRPLGSVEHLV
jgi:hypothetical protein